MTMKRRMVVVVVTAMMALGMTAGAAFAQGPLKGEGDKVGQGGKTAAFAKPTTPGMSK